MGISSTGLGSGLEIKAMVEGLVKADITPLQTPHDKKLTHVTTELSAIGQLKSVLSSFQTSLNNLSNASQFNKMKYVMSEPGYFSAAVSEEAVPGVYQIQVQQLAQAHSLASGYFTSNTSSVGSGDITINFGTYSSDKTTFTPNTDVNSVTIKIAQGSDSLTAVCDAINGAKAGVTATIVQDNTGSRLTLTSTQTGENYSMQISGDLTALNYDPTTNVTSLNQTMQAQNSLVQINGLLLNQSSNKLEDALTGITLNLQQADTATTISLTVENNKEHITELVNDFVKKYNECMTFLTNLTGYNKETKQHGFLQGDKQLRELKLNLYHLATSPVANSGPIQSLADLGITSNRQGLLEINQDTYSEVLANNFTAIGALFSKSITATDPNIVMGSMDTKAPSGIYDVYLSEYTPGVSMSGTIGDEPAISTDGITLNVTGSLDTLSIEVLSGEAGSRGQIIINDGLASLLDDYLDSFMDKKSDLSKRKSHLDEEVAQLDEGQNRINLRIDSLEKRYYRQWNAVDLLIGRMQNTSASLTQILGNIPKLKTNK